MTSNQGEREKILGMISTYPIIWSVVFNLTQCRDKDYPVLQ